MPTHVEAIAALVAAAGLPCFDGDVPPGAPLKRVVLSAPEPLGAEATVDGSEDYVEAHVQVKYVGANGEQARWVARAAIAALHRQSPAVDGWTASIRRRFTGPFVADRDVTLTPTDTHAVAAVDTYLYRATRNA